MDGWIKVKERLPEDNVVVLAVVEVEGQVEARRTLALIEDAEWRDAYEADIGDPGVLVSTPFFDDETITHWMPLPELPGKEGGNG